MQESEIQVILEEVILENRLWDAIDGKDLVDKLYEAIYDYNSLPSFSIDYFSKKKLINAAKNVIKSLDSVHIITTASRNISIDRKEKLFPDLILINEEKRKLIIIEIKRSNKTARETLTEMLAYDYEVRNLLPFLSNFEVQFCIVSTEYSDLLNHSVSGLVTWESKQILCLKVEVDKGRMKLRVHFPNAWTSLGSNNFPPNAIPTCQIILYRRTDDKVLPDAESAVFYTASLIAKEGDRNNSHGFVLIWRDCWENWEDVAGATKFHLTVGFINPYVFLPFAQNLGIIDGSQSPLGKYLIENSQELIHTYSFCEQVLEKGLAFLRQYFDVHIEGFSYWDLERERPYEMYNAALLTMRHRALPLRIELWGALGDFARDFIIHPGVKRHILSGFSKKILSCEDPFIGIPIIDNLSGITRLDKRGFTCKSLFEIGVSLGTIATLYNTAIHQKDDELRNLPASITWYMLDIQAVLLELGIQYKSSGNLTTPPPTVKFRIAENFEEALSSIQSLIEWIYTKFLDDQQKIQSHCLNLGLIAHPLLDDSLSHLLPDEQRETIENQIYEISSALLKTVASACLSDYISEDTVHSIINEFASWYLECDMSQITKDSLVSLIENIPASKHIELYTNTLMNLLDEFVPPVTYISSSSNISEYKHVDWGWVRDEILNFRERGVGFPAVKVDATGGVNIVDISMEVYANLLIKKIQFEREFVFVISENGVQLALVKEWREAGL